MAQITNGLRSVLSHPLIYSLFQSIMGGDSFRKIFVENDIKPFPGMTILDMGCGPADILAYLPQVKYYGYDINQDYINQARNRFGASGNFYCKHLNEDDLHSLPKFDVVLALGLIHHLEDDEAISAMKLAFNALKIGGRLLTLDGCFDPNQSLIARLLISNDRGQNVRNKAGYEELARTVFEETSVEVRHKVWIPYTHCVMECRR